MKKSIVWVSSVLQFIAAIMYFGIIRSVVMWSNGETALGTVILVVFAAIAAQISSFQLKKKFKDEVEKAENIMQRSQTSYGWIALGVFVLAFLIVSIYILATK